MNANWRSLAAFAWEKHLASGRGLVMVPEDDFVQASSPQFAALRIRYVPAQSPELAHLPEWDGGKEQAWLDTYDPAQKIIVMILRDGGGTSGYLIGARPSPPECYAAKIASTN